VKSVRVRFCFEQYFSAEDSAPARYIIRGFSVRCAVHGAPGEVALADKYFFLYGGHATEQSVAGIFWPRR
jgi:hypothetical protein